MKMLVYFNGVPVVITSIAGRSANRANTPGANNSAEFYKRAVYIRLFDHVMPDLKPFSQRNAGF
jgi:hypothetical protein